MTGEGRTAPSDQDSAPLTRRGPSAGGQNGGEHDGVAHRPHCRDVPGDAGPAHVPLRWAGRRTRDAPGLARVGLLLGRAFQEYRKDHCQQLAAAIAYHLLFSIFPIALVGVAVLALVVDTPQARRTVVDAVVGTVPLTDSGQRQLQEALAVLSDSAGALGLLGAGGLLWSAMGVMAAIRTALNIAWNVEQRRPFLRGKLVDLLLVGATFLLLLVAFAVTLLVNLVQAGTGWLPQALTWLAAPAVTGFSIIVALSVLTGTFLALFLLVPATKVRIRHLWPGAVVAAAGPQLLQYGFAAYVTHFADYNRVYGSIGTIIAALFFVYLASSVFLYGAEVAAKFPRLPDRPRPP